MGILLNPLFSIFKLSHVFSYDTSPELFTDTYKPNLPLLTKGAHPHDYIKCIIKVLLCCRKMCRILKKGKIISLRIACWTRYWSRV